MATAIEMASNALVLVGDNPISDFDEPGFGAQTAKALYENIYETVLTYHPWTYTLKEQQLNLTSFEPDQLTNYQYAYQVPSDMLRIWAVFPQSDYVIVGDKLYSNETELLMRYQYRLPEQYLREDLVTAMQYCLAGEFAYAVTEDLQKSQYYKGLYLDAVIKAANTDSQGVPALEPVDKPFTSVRFNGDQYWNYN